jgi:CHAD domain-containing protein
MAARLRKGQSGAKRIGQIVDREAGKALDEIEAARQPRDTAVHDARKRIKRARAALRLIREPLGERRFQRENTALRDAARPLSEIRDAKILVEAFDALVTPAARRKNNGLHRLRETLMAHQARVRRGVFGRKEPLAPTADALRSVRKRRHRWPLGRDGWSALGPGVQRVYRAGRKRFASARRQPSDERFHEWRKQAKYLWHQLEIMEPMAPAPLRRLGRQLHLLSDHLGDDHDLAVLKQRLARSRARVPRTAVRAVSRLIDNRRLELRAKALRLGERLYQPPPKHFARQLQCQWRAWRANSR